MSCRIARRSRYFEQIDAKVLLVSLSEWGSLCWSVYDTITNLVQVKLMF